MPASYSDLIQKLFLLTQKSKLGLENMLRGAKQFGNPHESYPTIHIAGTNGKGSVSTKIAKSYELAGYKTALYTSPHISSFRERIKINSDLIPESAVVRILPRLLETDLTFFEVTTLLAFLWFKEEKVDVAVIETGLGGRLDATNIITPKLSIITSIGYDHKEILGNTLDEIAYEKGGIIKPGVPVVLGPSCPDDKLKGIKVTGPFETYDEENSAIAKRALEVLNIPPLGILDRPRCRFEVHGQYILDVSHNPDGMNALIKMLKKNYPDEKFNFVVGLSSNKDIPLCLNNLDPLALSYTFTESTNGRGEKAEVLKTLRPGEAFSEVKEALRFASKKEGKIVVCGTFFIMNDALEFLGIPVVKDEVDLNEKIAINYKNS